MEYTVIVIRKSDCRQKRTVALKSRDLDEAVQNALVFRASCSHVWIYTGNELVETIKEPIR